MEDRMLDFGMNINCADASLENAEECVDAMTADLMRRMGCSEKVARLCGKVVARQNDSGDVCLPVDDEALAAELKSSPGITFLSAEETDDEVRTPFLFYGNWLYTRRNWEYEKNIRQRVRKMAASAMDKPIKVPTDGPFAVKDQSHERGMEPCQWHGVEMMCNHRFSLLTGGPGTGKTFTIARAVKLILAEEGKMRLGLAAPTGKAAARVKEAMAFEAKSLGLTDIPNAMTIHSLLGSNYDLVSFKHNRQNPLPLDWLIVDEASMIDLALMSKLVDALPDGCRLTLVGDAHQLASVEPGRVFGDLCQMEGLPICKLDVSRRFPQGGEIDALAHAVNCGDGEKALEMLRKPENQLLHYEVVSSNTAFQPELWGSFLKTVKSHFAEFARQTTVGGALAKLNECRILCALRHGPYGVQRLNEVIRRVLGEQTPVPMMIVKNNHSLGVSNGDVGVVMPKEDTLCLLKEDGTIRRLPLALLPDREMAFASTIHKAQGSEYSDVIIVIPPSTGQQKQNPLLTREILYTAVTRTKKQVFLFSDDVSIKTCCQQCIKRETGLRSN